VRAHVNGLLAPLLPVGVLLAASDSKLMQGQPSSLLGRCAVGMTTAVMIFAAVAISIVPIFVFYLFAQRHLIRGFTGGIRG